MHVMSEYSLICVWVGETLFVSARHVDVAGWTGRLEDIVVFHFLNGESDDAFASRYYTRDVNKDRFEGLLQLFYGHPDEGLFHRPLETPLPPDLRTLVRSNFLFKQVDVADLQGNERSPEMKNLLMVSMRLSVVVMYGFGSENAFSYD